MTASSISDWAARYIERFNLALVPLIGKVPIGNHWNADARLIRDPAKAREYFRPGRNIGACLEASGLASVDCDDLEHSRLVLAHEGIDLDELIRTTPTIVGRAPRLEFAAPPGVDLKRKAVTWPARCEGEKPITIVEFRAGRVQDVLPPSVHPDTGKPYVWRTPPKDGFPLLPEKLLVLWLGFDNFKDRARNLCPWAEPEPEKPEKLPISRPHHGPSVIRAFNDAHEVTALLESHGYVRSAKNRWSSPNGHGMAGVVVLPSGKVFCHHMSDPLGDGHAHDAFDLFAHFDHGGDVRAATRAAAEMLGMRGNQR